MAFHKNTVGLLISPSGRYIHDIRTVKSSANSKALNNDGNYFWVDRTWSLVLQLAVMNKNNKIRGRKYMLLDDLW